jgi:hypothetical protein
MKVSDHSTTFNAEFHDATTLLPGKEPAVATE